MNTERDQGWVLIKGRHRVELIDIGEGINGDYDPTDPDDEPVLCIDVLTMDESGRWLLVDDAFCRTDIPVTAPAEARQTVLEAALEQVVLQGATRITLEPFAAARAARLTAGQSTSPGI